MKYLLFLALFSFAVSCNTKQSAQGEKEKSKDTAQKAVEPPKKVEKNEKIVENEKVQTDTGIRVTEETVREEP